MNLIDGALGYLTAGVIEKASVLVGESPAGTRRGLETAVPAIVAGLAGEASRSGGSANILRMIEDAGLSGPETSVAERLSGDSGEELVALGKGLIGRVFGGRMGGVFEAAARATGVAPPAMMELAGLAAPLVFGVLGSTVHARHLDAAGLAGLLGAQRGPAVSALPAAVIAALPDGQAAAEAPSSRVAVTRQRERPRPPQTRSHFWPLLLLIPVAILAALYFRKPATETSRPRPRLGAGLPSAPTTPAPETSAVLPESTISADILEFLASPTAEPSKRFLFDDLNFEVKTARLTPQALTMLDGVAAALKEYPSAVVLVEGHTDASGDATDNRRLSMSRADAVRDALVVRGVAAERIATAGMGQDHPVASNQTPEGRAKNRRTELVVTR